MSFAAPTTLEIDRKLRSDFRRRVKDFGISADAVDPVLAVLFRTLAQQIETVYADTGRMRQALLDELMDGIRLTPRLACPAQSVVRFLSTAGRAKVLRGGTELNGTASSGQRLIFATDATVEVSAASITVALAYQDQSLQLLPAVETSDMIQACRPSLDPVRVNLGPQPAVFLAIENLPATHLSRHGIFFELSPGSWAIQNSLRGEPWWIYGPDGDLSSEGLLRPRRVIRGVCQLDWQSGAVGPAQTAEELPELIDGFYAGRQYIFPVISRERQLTCAVPRLLESPLEKICGRDLRKFLETPRAWIRIPMSPDVPSLAAAINGILLHAITVSNVFCRNQTVHFQKDGSSVPVGRELNGMRELLVAPLSVTSSSNIPYSAGLRPGADASVGWYELRNNRITLHPGQNADGTPQPSANVRLWMTNGGLGNRVGPGDITGFANSAVFDQMRVAHVAAAAGGTDGEDYTEAQRRFAESLLTRGRIVTRADLVASVMGFDRRILAVEVQSRMERRNGALRRVERLWVTLDRNGFSMVDIELPALQQDLSRHLTARAMHGIEVDVRFEWDERTAA
jgi:hypothetical protein